MFKKILIGIILFGVVAVLLLQIDDELNPEVAAFLEQAKPAEKSDAYLYLLGIVAAKGEDPSVVGKQLFADMQQAEEQYSFNDDSFGYEGYLEIKRLSQPEGKLFCSSWQEGCWQTVFENRHDREKALQENATLLNRYKAFKKLTDYHSLAQPTEVEVYPPFHYLLKANRLVALEAINMEPAQSLNMLLGHITELRLQLKRADNLIGKMIFTVMLSDSLDVASVISHKENIDFKGEILPLTQRERDLASAIPREFAMGYGVYSQLDNNPEFFARNGWRSYTPSWLVRLFFKPNMTANDAFLFYSDIVRRSQLAQIEFTESDFGITEESYPQLSSIRNSVGNILNGIAKPNFDKYITRLFDLNAKITIFNQTTNKAELPENLAYIQNPYYETGGTAYYSEDGKSICLTGPLADDKNQRCLRVKL